MELKSESNITQRQLPWIVAGAALLLYLVTSTTTLSFMGLGGTVQAGHWYWQPTVTEPVFYLLTYPIHWLPAVWHTAAINAFAAICAALTLGLLARSVALLPHDRTREQRQNEHDENGLLSIRAAWVPVTLAVLACGLQRTFWENAVLGTGEMLDLLLFAYVIRCLLEFRIEQNDSWLYRMAVVYGVGVTNNFAMIAFFPAFLVALIWIKGRSFFNLKFCTRMLLLGLSGLLVYFVLPITQLWYQYADLTFWDVLRMNLGQQKQMLLQFPRFLLLFTSITSLLPVLFMGIKWPASVGDTSNVGNFLTNLMTHVLHAFFLAACAYVTFDLAFSPRTLAAPLGYPFLTTYYLGALSIGYFSGYFLLVFGKKPVKTWQRPSLIVSILNKVIVALVWVGLVALPAALVVKNWDHMQALTSKYLSQFGMTAARELKEIAPQGAVVLSDDYARLYATYEGLLRQGGGQQYVMVQSASLNSPAYHKYLHQKYPKVWPDLSTNLPPDSLVDPLLLIQLLNYVNLSNNLSLVYLHPTFGYYLEKFYLQPRNLLFEMKAYPSNTIDKPLMTEAEAKSNVEFWKQFRDQRLTSLVRDLKKFEKKEESNPILVQSGMLFSRPLNQLGVELQKAGRLEQAAECFINAVALNSLNFSAMRNLEVNQALRAGKKEFPKPGEKIESGLAAYGGKLDILLSIGGAIDDDIYGFKLAELFAMNRGYRQAAQYLRRILTFDPDNIDARLGLMSLYNQIVQPDFSLKTIAEVRAQTRTNAFSMPLEMQLVQTEANAYISKGDSKRALGILENAQVRYPTNIEPFLLLSDYYLARKDITNALKVVEAEMKALPASPTPLIDYARLKMGNAQTAEAIPYLDQALKLDGKNVSARFNRAVAHLELKHFKEAESDYRELETLMDANKLIPQLTWRVAYGLHSISFQKKDRLDTVKYGKEYLKLAPANAPEVKQVEDQMKQIKKGAF